MDEGGLEVGVPLRKRRTSSCPVRGGEEEVQGSEGLLRSSEVYCRLEGWLGWRYSPERRYNLPMLTSKGELPKSGLPHSFL